MKKIILIGSGGSGKSTLARQLGNKLNIKVHHLDALFWKPNWEGVPREEQIAVQNNLIKDEKWIIDGNYGGTMDIRLNAADTIIFLDIHRTICIYRAFKRIVKYRNKKDQIWARDVKKDLICNFLNGYGNILMLNDLQF